MEHTMMVHTMWQVAVFLKQGFKSIAIVRIFLFLSSIHSIAISSPSILFLLAFRLRDTAFHKTQRWEVQAFKAAFQFTQPKVQPCIHSLHFVLIPQQIKWLVYAIHNLLHGVSVSQDLPPKIALRVTTTELTQCLNTLKL